MFFGNKKLMAASVLALLFVGLLAAGGGTSRAVAEGLTVDGVGSVGFYVDEEGLPRVENQYIEESSETTVTVNPAYETGRNGAFWAFVALVAVSAAAAVAVVLVPVFTRKKGKIDKFAVLSAACAALFFLTASGIGVYGMTGGYGSVKITNYYWAGGAPITASTENDRGYCGELKNRQVLSTFEFGFEGPYTRGSYMSPHYWEKDAPQLDYTSVELERKNLGLMSISGTEGEDDNSNYWYVLPEIDGSANGTAETVYRIEMRGGRDNSERLKLYDKLTIVYRGTNTNGGEVNLTVLAQCTRRGIPFEENELGYSKEWYTLGTYRGESGKKVEITFDLGVIPLEYRDLSKLAFRTEIGDIGHKPNGKDYIRNDLYYMEISGDRSVTNSVRYAVSDGVVTADSVYLGSMGYALYGAYSGTGFYDPDDGKWKCWFGAGLPEQIASDNVYYIESEDPAKGWSVPYRIDLVDPQMKLTPENISPGYGGDPSVIKIGGVYYMYFSALEYKPDETFHYNKVYLATSRDGKKFDLYPEPVIDVPSGNDHAVNSGYGAGAPSVVYKDGIYYLYYYCQTSTQNGKKGQPTGFVMRSSADPYRFDGDTVLVNTVRTDGAPAVIGACDVKYIDSIGVWVATGYTEENLYLAPESGKSVEGVVVGVSEDGTNFKMGFASSERPAQNFDMYINHNPGFIGKPDGHGYEYMFLCYGANDLDLRGTDAGLQMDTRMQDYTLMRFTKS